MAESMTSTSGIVSSKKYFLLAILVWILLWAIPWGAFSTNQLNLYLAFVIDLIRLGVALALFIVPGALLYILIEANEGKSTSLLGILAFGFSFSVLLISGIGLIGRLAGFSFSMVRNIFVLFGAIEFVLAASSNASIVLPKINSRESLKSWLHNPPLALALFIVISFTLNNELFFLDDSTYGAYLTNWQFSEQLGFKNLVHHLDALELSRFWLAMYPMGQALLSNLSGVPGLLLLSNYLELLLTPMAVLVLYWFVRNLGLAQKPAGYSVLIQVSLYAWLVGEQWPVGKWFFESISEDKVSTVFFLAPVFFIAELGFLQNATLRSRVLFTLSGLAIVLTHPVMLFFSCSIAGILALLAWFTKKSNFRRTLEIGILCILLMIPYAIIRLTDRTGEIAGPYYGDEQARASFQIERYANIFDNRFYGLNPEVLMFADLSVGVEDVPAIAIFRIIPIVILLAGTVVSIGLVKRGPVYWYVFSCCLLIFMAALPYTGWTLGYFVSVRMLSRISWFAPYGLAAVLVAQAWFNWRKSSFTISSQHSTTERRRWMMGLALSLLFVGPILLFSLTNRLPKYFERLDHNRQLTELGAYVDRITQTYTTVVTTDYDDQQLLPTASAHASLISFREEIEYNGFNNSLPIHIVRDRIAESNEIRKLNPSVIICPLLEKYGVKFMLVPTQDAAQFENKIRQCDVPVDIVKRTKDIVLLKLH